MNVEADLGIDICIVDARFLSNESESQATRKRKSNQIGMTNLNKSHGTLQVAD